jgi:cystathionine beta-lyase/cystathionine gamma-synthase
MADSMKYLGIGTSFGQAETLCETGHMVFYGMTMEERAEFGVPDGFVRLSVGLEDTDDLIADMAQALDKIPEEMIKARVSAPAAKSEGVFRPSIVENE